MTLFTIYQYERWEGCSDPIVTYSNMADVQIYLGKLKKEFGSTEFQVLQHELGVPNPNSVYEIR